MSGAGSFTADGNRPYGDPGAAAAAQDGRLPARGVTIEVRARPGTTTIFVTGELDLVTMPLLAEQLILVARDKPRRLVFDLAGTYFMDCVSARLIAGAGRWLPENRRPVVRCPGPCVRRVLELTGLDACCEIEGLVVDNIRAWCSAGAREGADR